MKRFTSALALATLVAVWAPGAAAAQGALLSAVAASLGYTYAYLGPEDAVALSRPGVTVVIRPGERLFDVNDQTEAMDGAAPYFSRHDLLISAQLAARLRQIAVRFPAEVPYAGAARRADSASASASRERMGAIADLTVAQLTGTEDVRVTGTGPANLPVTLTLVARLSKDIPDVVLSRHQVYADSAGHFQTSVSTAPGYFDGAALTLIASSLPGVSSASARIIMKAPNDGVTVPADKPF